MAERVIRSVAAPPQRRGWRLTSKDRADAERGSGTVLAIGLVGALAMSLVAVAAVGQAVLANQRAVSAADLAALAGAQALIDGLDATEACAAADTVATAMNADLIGCVPTGSTNELRVDCAVQVQLGVLGARSARATAVAGPP
ncbi:MAG: pilus assembly protein TadG-related protein [Bifidobacteriaceae bacterium]|nr:pilus assembly protein TadG-related protein [Bifidobacteriaceae bacterium]